MAEVKIVDLPEDANVRGIEVFPVSDAGVTKKVATAALKDYVLAELQKAGTVSSMTDSDVVVNTADGLKRISWKDFNTLLDSVFVNIADNQTISGKKTFSGSVDVPAPLSNMNPATKKYVDDQLAGKVASISGKGLSTEDFTTAFKTKLEGLSANADVVHYTVDGGKTSEEKAQARVNIGAASSADVANKAAETPTFSIAGTLEQPTGAGETCETLWGKAWKCISSLASHLADTTSHVTAAERSNWNAKGESLTFDESPMPLSDNPVKSKGILAALNKKQTTLEYDSEPTFGSQKMVKSGAVYDAVSKKQDANKLVTKWQATPDDSHFPSEKLVKESIASSSVSPVSSWSSSPSDVNVPSEKLVKSSLDAKGVIVASFSSSTSDTKYPSEKLVKDSLDAKGTLVTSFSATTSDTNYPSEKLVKDSLDAKQTTANLVTTVRTSDEAADDKYPSEKAVAMAIASGGIVVDATPTAGSTNPVQSGGVYTALMGKQSTLTFDSVPTSSSSNPCTSGGIKGALDEKGTKVTVWSSSLLDTNYPSEKLVKETIDGLGVSTEIDSSVTIADSDSTKTFQVGTSPFKYFYVTDSRTTESAVTFKVGITKGNKWTYQKVLVCIPSAKQGTINLASVVSDADRKLVRGDGVSSKVLSTTASKGYLIQVEIFNKDSYQDVFVDVREY